MGRELRWPGQTAGTQDLSIADRSWPLGQKGANLRDADLKGPLSCTRIWVDDVNSDGKLDILVGDMVPLISPADKEDRTGFVWLYLRK